MDVLLTVYFLLYSKYFFVFCFFFCIKARVFLIFPYASSMFIFILLYWWFLTRCKEQTSLRSFLKLYLSFPLIYRSLLPECPGQYSSASNSTSFIQYNTIKLHKGKVKEFLHKKNSFTNNLVDRTHTVHTSYTRKKRKGREPYKPYHRYPQHSPSSQGYTKQQHVSLRAVCKRPLRVFKEGSASKVTVFCSSCMPKIHKRRERFYQALRAPWGHFILRIWSVYLVL